MQLVIEVIMHYMSTMFDKCFNLTANSSTMTSSSEQTHSYLCAEIITVKFYLYSLLVKEIKLYIYIYKNIIYFTSYWHKPEWLYAECQKDKKKTRMVHKSTTYDFHAISSFLKLYNDFVLAKISCSKSCFSLQ